MSYDSLVVKVIIRHISLNLSPPPSSRLARGSRFAALVGPAPCRVVGRVGVYVWGTPWGVHVELVQGPSNRCKMQAGGEKYYPIVWFGIGVAHVEMLCY